ncbi:MAG: hypothetical protein R3282_09205 [Rhodothermales bacterium]|nr:hypothetical protein [Rhodothermales bacterium]
MMILLAVLMLLAPALKVPDCLYVAYGCEYYIWDHGDGTGEALVTCDGGGTYSSYSGLVGYCPDQ